MRRLEGEHPPLVPGEHVHYGSQQGKHPPLIPPLKGGRDMGWFPAPGERQDGVGSPLLKGGRDGDGSPHLKRDGDVQLWK